MNQVGEQVVYGIHGICNIVAQEERTVDRKRVTYLVLEPVGQHGSRYLVPIHSEAAMGKLRPMLTPDELEALLRSDRIRQDCWIQDENRRKQTYRELIGSGDRERLMAMVSTLYRHRAAQAAAGRKCHMCDENFLRDAERILTGEFSVVLNMPPEQVRQYLRSSLEG